MSKTLFTASTIWKGPNDIEPVVYFAGITQKLTSNLVLQDSYDLDYAAGTAFKLIGNSENDLGRLYKPFSNDNLIISNVPNNINYRIDDEKNLVIFPQDSPLTTNDLSIITCKLYQNYASIFKSNLVSFDKVIDFRILRERAVSSMLSTDDGIFIACTCGNLWFYDGNVLNGPIFNLQDGQNLPATSLIKHKFDHEDEEYIYISSDVKPRLYRSKISTAKNGVDWERVYPEGELNSNAGGILSMTSAFNKIFLGCRNNKVLIYSKSNEIELSESNEFISNGLIETNVAVESLETVNIKSDNINDFEPLISDIRCIESARNQVFIGLSNKSEIWAYSEVIKSNPEILENWVNYTFDEVFKNDPAPSQYYSYNSNTLTRNDSNLGITRYYDSNSKNYIKEAILIKGNTLSSTGQTVNGLRLFEFSDGSDWEQTQLLNLPSQEFFEVKCASTSEITSLTNIANIDGYSLINYDYVLLKDQSSGNENNITNGIYRYFSNSLEKYDDFLIDEDATVLGFIVANGSINKNNRYFCTVDNFNSTNPEFNRSKYTLEFELRNLAYSSATASTNFKTSGVLNSLLNNEERLLSSTGFTGYQGFEVADSYGIVNLQFNDSNIVLQSGNNKITKELPNYGDYKNWTFSTSSSLAATTNGWQISNFVSSMIGSTESVSDAFSNTYTRYFLRITPSLRGNPSIESSQLNIGIDPEAILKMRVRITPQNSFGFENSFINLYWSDSVSDFSKKTKTEIITSDDFIDYEFKPIWKNNLENLKIEFENLPESSSRPTYIDIDYIRIINEDKIFNLNEFFSKVRITVEGRDVKVWLGKQNYPYINSKNFINLDNYNKKYINSAASDSNYNKPYIKFGKIDEKSGNSLFAFSSMSFIVGETYDPIARKINNFSNAQKLSSTGGIRFFAYHDGTIYCATDGFDSNNVNVSPDDRMTKVFSYSSNSDSWDKNEYVFDRKQIFNDDGTYNLLGIVRPLNLISYKGLLYLSGQYANIKVV